MGKRWKKGKEGEIRKEKDEGGRKHEGRKEKGKNQLSSDLNH